MQLEARFESSFPKTSVRKYLDWSIRISGVGLPDRNRGNSGARINAHTHTRRPDQTIQPTRESLCFLLVLATGSADYLLVRRLHPALMRLRHVYLGLCVLGVVVPYSQFIPWLMQHGLDMDLFMRELFATRIGAFFAFDVLFLRLRSSSLSLLSGQ